MYINSPFIFGCEQLGGYQWGKVDTNEINKALNNAYDEGINFFDTADCYGQGLSEIRIGEIFKKKEKTFLYLLKEEFEL